MANGLPLVADGKWQMAFIEITPWCCRKPHNVLKIFKNALANCNLLKKFKITSTDRMENRTVPGNFSNRMENPQR
jgi:hypothetical protein